MAHSIDFEAIKELVAKGEVDIATVIDAVIDINGMVGVGLITLGDGLQNYIYQHTTMRQNPKSEITEELRIQYNLTVERLLAENGE